MIDAEGSLDLVDVVGDAIGAPQIRHRILVAGIVHIQLFEQRRIDIHQVGQLRLVELLESPRFDLLAEKMVARHHHVITRTTG